MEIDEHEAKMLRRAAKACRNAKGQMVGSADWFDWVPQHLKQIADLADAARDDQKGAGDGM